MKTDFIIIVYNFDPCFIKYLIKLIYQRPNAGYILITLLTVAPYWLRFGLCRFTTQGEVDRVVEKVNRLCEMWYVQYLNYCTIFILITYFMELF